MTTTIWEMIASTPWWVYALFIYLIRIGLLAAKPRTISFKSLLIVPVIFISMSLISMFAILHITLIQLALWFTMGLGGFTLGWLQFRAMKVRAIRHESKLHVPGSWMLLGIVMILFTCRYYLNYETAIDPTFLSQSKYASYIYLLYGLFTGLFVGRLSYALRVLKVGPYFTAS